MLQRAMLAAQRLRGLSTRIYVAFLLAAVVPVMVAGWMGIYYSFEALKRETLQHLDHEVSGRAASLGRFFDQVTSELLLLTSLPVVLDVADALANPGPIGAPVRERVERAFAAFARAYPYMYQVRFLGREGREIVRVDRQGDRPHVVPLEALQDKADRYYVHETLALQPGQVYVSPLDLNIEHGKIEQPERPVVRFATPMPDRKGRTMGMLIINLHADFMLDQIQEMAGMRGGMAYLFDRAGFFVSRSADEHRPAASLRMRSVEELTPRFPRPLLATIVGGGHGTGMASDWIVAYAPIAVGRALAERSDSSMEWAIASAFPRARLFDAVFNLYLLYAVLGLALLATAVGGFLLSRHLLRPLSLLAAETEEIARGNFAHRVEIRGSDEIADLGTRFNAMAAKLEQSYRSLEAQKARLEDEVRGRTAQLEREQEARRELDRQMFQTEKMTAMGELAMGLAHEIGNPLAGMKAVVQMLEEEKLDPQTRGYLARVHGEIDRLAAFLRTFQGFAAPQETHPDRCRLRAALDDVLLWTRKEARARGIRIDYASCCKEVPDVWADPAQLKQVLLNLVINAIQAMPAGGTIEIGMCTRDADLKGDVPRMRFCVSDTGPGIPPDVLPRIFDPFFTTRTEGSGLGLAVARKIAMQHGADIEVHSEPGKGTRFEFAWPICAEVRPARADAAVEAVHG
jgi:signal transduction histidine kinase